MALPTPNVDPERPDEQLRDHIYDFIIKNGPNHTGWLWKFLKPLGLVSHPKDLHGRLFKFYGNRKWGFKRDPLSYVRRNPDTWEDRKYR
eukprot:UN02297